METKQIKIEVPNGYEIDKEKSTFENIILKPIEVKLPLSVDELPTDTVFNKYDSKLNAFRDLLLLRDAWNGDWRADWEDVTNKYCIYFFRDRWYIKEETHGSYPLHFKTYELAKKFFAQFEDLINEAKELL
jgi:hypothetical protein